MFFSQDQVMKWTAKFGVLVLALLKMHIFWEVTQWCLQYFKGSQWVQWHSRAVEEERTAGPLRWTHYDHLQYLTLLVQLHSVTSQKTQNFKLFSNRYITIRILEYNDSISDLLCRSTSICTHNLTSNTSCSASAAITPSWLNFFSKDFNCVSSSFFNCATFVACSSFKTCTSNFSSCPNISLRQEGSAQPLDGGV